MKKLVLADKELLEVKKILKDNIPNNSKVYAFGSRVTGDVKKYSDLDLALDFDRKISLEEFADLREKFSESNLIFSVDLVDLNNINFDFKNLILNSGTEIVYN